eukprot:CAMPEP_0181205062 /NCGR_PEP_ID=MMETSP1096-20121128/20266_1 /TAXON_ID=156174 ORGANISM="Chrysochromulina ericina, Strain CCMP281" /NCGR_SAMPLE_ID=MMETSP1096 /ASSEMBLY_ACC=CAM_ASM_000453 /LENGTH=454 /DNA_ID=CAMNT_0023295799 /DNA_START=95 /DNA_END=1459 /DNA_ORIENTATION=+
MIAARARQMKLLTPGALWQDEQQVVQNICAHKARREETSNQPPVLTRASREYLWGCLARVAADDHAMGMITLAQVRFRLRSLQRPLAESATKRMLLHNVRSETAHCVVIMLSWLLGSFELICGVLVLSWSNLPLKPTPVTPEQLLALKYFTLALVSVYFPLILYRWWFPSRFGRVFLQVVDICVALGAAVLHAVMWTEGSFEAGPTAFHQALLTLFTAWRMKHLLSMSPHGSSVGIHLKHVLGSKTFQLIWVSRSAELLRGYLPVLGKLLRDVNLSLYGSDDHRSGGLDKYLRLTIYCTEKDESAVKQLKALEEREGLQGLVQYCRPDLETELISRIKYSWRGHMIATSGTRVSHSSLVTFCGGPGVARLCRQAVATANNIAMDSGHGQFTIKSRAEFYGVAGGAVRRPPKRVSDKVQIAVQTPKRMPDKVQIRRVPAGSSTAAPTVASSVCAP